MDHDKRLEKLVVLTAGGPNPQIMINALAGHFANMAVIEESYEPKSVLLRRRARKLGCATAVGQLGTMIVSRFGKRLAQRRTGEIVREYGVSLAQNPAIPITRVSSLNDADAHAAITALKPDIILTISCRLLTRTTLAAIPCPIVNFHAGINPAYRGQMGGYWAARGTRRGEFRRDPASGRCRHGYRRHAGGDSGQTILHDTISTYPLLLTAAGAETTATVLSDVLDGTARPFHPPGPSALRFPPPVWTYLFHGLTRDIW